MHFFLFIYFATFICIFGVNNIDVYIYLILCLLMLLSWYFLECCILTYYELKSYGIDMKNIPTTFHPTMYSLFNEHSDNIMSMLGILMTINVIYILYYNKKIHIIYKIIYLLIFEILFVDSVLKSRNGVVQLYKIS
jgi:hypothetical protein